MPYVHHRLWLSITFANAAVPTFATERTQAIEAPTAIDSIIVTGTHAAGRTLAESNAPIDILTPQASQATGTAELATALSLCLAGHELSATYVY